MTVSCIVVCGDYPFSCVLVSYSSRFPLPSFLPLLAYLIDHTVKKQGEAGWPKGYPRPWMDDTTETEDRFRLRTVRARYDLGK